MSELYAPISISNIQVTVKRKRKPVSKWLRSPHFVRAICFSGDYKLTPMNELHA